MFRCATFTILFSVAYLVAQDAAARFPLDPVTEQELSDAVTIVKNAGYMSDSAVFAQLSLEEPAKSAVLQWKPGMAVDREIMAIVYDRKARKTTEAVVSLTSGKL